MARQRCLARRWPNNGTDITLHRAIKAQQPFLMDSSSPRCRFVAAVGTISPGRYGTALLLFQLDFDQFDCLGSAVGECATSTGRLYSVIPGLQTPGSGSAVREKLLSTSRHAQQREIPSPAEKLKPPIGPGSRMSRHARSRLLSVICVQPWRFRATKPRCWRFCAAQLHDDDLICALVAVYHSMYAWFATQATERCGPRGKP